MLGRLGSLWLDTAEHPSRPPLPAELRVDVAVLGGGITGLTTGLLLAREGASVALLEARRIGSGVTGYTTAKVTSLHGLTYAQLSDRHGEELARLYGEANEAGVARVAALVDELGIACDFRRKSNVTYAESPADVEKIEREVSAARRAGLPASYTEQLDLPFAIAAAVRFEDQAEFHPLKYLAAIAAAFEEAGGRLFEASMAVSVGGGSPWRVHTAGGPALAAEQVVVATHFPFLDRGFYFARMHPERSYVLAAAVDAAPDAMYLSTESPSHTIRAHELEDGRRFLLVGGESHKSGQADAAERYRRLARYATERFGLNRFDHHWATQDNVPVDNVPFVGKLHPRARGLWVATGYKKWGLAMGTAAGELLADLIGGRDSPWAELLDPSRVRLRASMRSFVKENANVGFHFFSDRLLRRALDRDLAPGEGKVVASGLEQRAICRDEDGRVHSLSARCTHLGCIVDWNAAELTWDCPCHGSRFAAAGEVIQGPAVGALPPAG